MTPKTKVATKTNKQTNKQEYMKIRKFCTSKDTVNRIKMQLTEWDKIFANHISDKGLVTRMYKEFLQLNKKEKIT